MNRLLDVLARPRIAFGAAGGLLLLGLVLMVLGWPEGDRTQRAMLQLSGLCLSLAVGAVVGWFVTRSNVRDRSGYRLVRLAMIGLVAFGVLLYLIAVVTMNGGLTPLAQFFIWLGFGVVAIYLLIKGVDKAAATTDKPRFVELLEGDESTAHSDGRVL